MSFKVRHYRSRIYNPLKKKIFKAVLAVLTAGLLFMLGWFLYEPIMKGLTEKNKEIIEDNPVVEPEKKETQIDVPLSFTEKGGISMTVPEEYLYSAIDYFTFLSNLPENVTSVVIDLKTKEGTVTYQSTQKSVLDAGASSSSAVDLSKRIDTARKLGLDVIGRVFAFEDATAPFHSADLAIRYENEDGVLWLDGNIDEGGKPWLNPYSDTAQKYVMDIIYDAVDFGLDAILVDGLCFPGEMGQQYAYYGVNADSISRNEILKQFTQRIYQACSGSETDIIISYDSYAVISGNENIYGGSPALFTGDALSPVISLSDFIGKKVSDDFYYKTVPEDVTVITEQIFEGLSYGTDISVYPTIRTRDLEKEQLKKMMDALEKLEASGFILEYSKEFYEEKPVTTETDLTGLPPQALPIQG